MSKSIVKQTLIIQRALQTFHQQLTADNQFARRFHSSQQLFRIAALPQQTADNCLFESHSPTKQALRTCCFSVSHLSN